MAKIEIYVNDNDPTAAPGARKIVVAEVVKDRQTTILVKLPDGNVVVRKKKRDVPNIVVEEFVRQKDGTYKSKEA